MAEEPKKDLTNLLELSQSVPPPQADGEVLEEKPVERIDAFESLDEYAKSNPAAEPPPEDFASGAPADLPAFDSPISMDAGSATGGLGGDIPGISAASPDPSPASFPGPSPEPGPAFESEPLPASAAGAAPDLAPEPNPVREAASEPDPAPAFADLPPEPLTAPPKPAGRPLERMKEFAERVPVGKPPVAAAYPFSVMITGALTPEECEKLVDVIERENMGIRQVDLEPQFEGGRVLIPRISEYAAVVIVQALRGTSAQIRVGPSDSIYSTADTREDSGDLLPPQTAEQAAAVHAEAQHPAEEMPVTPGSSLPSLPRYLVVDAVMASAALKTTAVEANHSPEYQETLDGLVRELKYKAFRKGATAILNFSVTLSSLSMPTHYRLTVVGSAVRAPGDPTAT